VARDSTGAGPVLLVEDDEGIRTEVADLLASDGHTVVEAGDGSEALTYLRSGSACSLVVLDMNLPVMNGWELLKRMRHEDGLQHIPVIILSGRPVAHAEGAPPVFKKPLGDPTDFLQAVRTHRAVSGRPGSET
jgi:two-component system, chemotaxis family, chemotaxis protein CheY